MERKLGQLNPIIINVSRDYHKSKTSYHSGLDNSRINGENYWCYSRGENCYSEDYNGVSNLNSWYSNRLVGTRLLAGPHINNKSILSKDRYTIKSHHINPSYRGVCKFFED